MSSQVKLKRGQKRCPECQNINAVRQRVCKYCKYPFQCKNSPIVGEVKDWEQLEKGTLIRVVQGTGPYFISKRDSEDGLSGEKICLGYTGVYKVMGIENTGIRVYGATPRNSGYTFLYMGPVDYSEATGTYQEPHRIKFVKKTTKRKRGK